MKVAIERDPIKVARQWGYEVTRLSPKDVVDKADYERGYRFRLSRAEPTQPYPRIIMARNESEIAAFLKREIGDNPVGGGRVSKEICEDIQRKLKATDQIYLPELDMPLSITRGLFSLLDAKRKALAKARGVPEIQYDFEDLLFELVIKDPDTT